MMVLELSIANNTIDVNNSTIEGKDIYLYAGRNSSGVGNLIDNTVNTEFTSQGTIAAGGGTPIATINENNTINVSGGTQVRALEDVTLLADQGGNSKARAGGLVLNIVGNVIPIPIEVKGTENENNTNKVNITGATTKIEAGINHKSAVYLKAVGDLPNGTTDGQLLTTAEKESLGLPDNIDYEYAKVNATDIGFNVSTGTIVQAINGSYGSGTNNAFYEYKPNTGSSSDTIVLDQENYGDTSVWNKLVSNSSYFDLSTYNATSTSVSQGTKVRTSGGDWYEYSGSSATVNLQTTSYSSSSDWTQVQSYASDDGENLTSNLDGKFFAIKPVELDDPNLVYANVGNLLLSQRNQLVEWMISHAGDSEAIARYEVQLDEINTTLGELGLLDYDYKSDETVTTLNQGDTVFYNGKVYGYSDAVSQSNVDLSTQNYNDTTKWRKINANVVSVKSELDLLFIDIPNIYASPGSVFIESNQDSSVFSSLVGTQLIARAGAQIDVVNETPFAMIVNDVIVRDNKRVKIDDQGNYTVFAPGNVYVNDGAVAGNNTTTLVENTTKVLFEDVVYKYIGTDGEQEILDNIDFANDVNWSSTNDDASSFDDSLTNNYAVSGKTISIVQDALSQVDYDFGSLSSDIVDNIFSLDQDLYITGDVVNQAGNLVINNQEGSINVSGSTLAESITITAKRDFNLNSEGWVHTNRDPRQYLNLDTLRAAAIADNDNSIVYNSATNVQGLNLKQAINKNESKILSQGSISITGRYINVNGLIQSGLDTISMTIDANFNPGNKTRELEDLSGVSFGSDIPLEGYYDATSNAIVLEKMAPTGGQITLAGEVLSTGNGRLKVANGYTSIDIDNNSSVDLILKGIDTTVDRQGKITIINTPTLEKTEYVADSSGVDVTEYQGTLIPASGDQISSISYSSTSGPTTYDFSSVPDYQPISGAVYVWTEGQEKTETEQRKFEKKSFNLFGGGTKFEDSLKNDSSYKWIEVFYTDEQPLAESESLDTSTGVLSYANGSVYTALDQDLDVSTIDYVNSLDWVVDNSLIDSENFVQDVDAGLYESDYRNQNLNLTKGDLVLNYRVVDRVVVQLQQDVDLEASGTVEINAGGAIAAKTTGNLELDNVTAVGDIRLQAGGSITDSYNDTNAAITSTGGGYVALNSKGVIEGSDGSSPLRLALGDASSLVAESVGNLSLKQIDIGSNADIFVERATTNTILDIESLSGNMAVGSVTAGTSVRVAASGDITDGYDDAGATIVNLFTDIDGNPTTGDVTLSADGDIGEFDNDVDVNIKEGNLFVTAGNDVFINSIASLNVGSATSTSGDINLNIIGDANIDLITASAGTVTIEALQSILDSRNDTAVNLIATNAVLLAGTGVGESNNPFETNLQRLEADISNGGIWLDNTGTLEIGGITSLDGIRATGEIDISAGNTITISEDIISDQSFAIDVSQDIIINAKIQVSGDDDVTIKTDGNIFFGSTGEIYSDSNLSVITLQADADNSGAGAIVMADGSVIDANDGLVDMSASQDITVSLLQTTAKVTIDSANGSILDADNNQGDDIIATNAVMKAGNGIGLSTNSLETNLDNLEADAGNGGIWLDNQNDLVIGNIDLATVGLNSVGDIVVTTTGSISVEEDVTGLTDVTLQTIDSTATGEDITVIGNVIVDGNHVNIQAGDDILLELNSTISATNQIAIAGDYTDADSQGTRIDLDGNIDATTVTVKGEADSDDIDINIQSLVGDTTVQTGDSSDTILVNQLPSLDTGNIGVVSRDELTLDGEKGGDTFTINITGATTNYRINVFDTGNVGDDELTIYGTQVADQFLFRASEQDFDTNNPDNGGLAFVGVLHGETDGDINTDVERINYNKNLELLIVETQGGDDFVTIDDNWTETIVRGGLGNDNFQVGQIFKAQRDANSGVATQDIFATTSTTRGFLSNGVSYVTTIEGGDDNDTFTVFRNLAVLDLKGEDGDDLFVIRSFATENSVTSNIDAGEGVDTVEYVNNAPINVSGGEGNDTLRLIGTEFADKFIITEDAIFGAGHTTTFDTIENLEIDGAEGKDEFYVLSTAEGVVTKLFGGLGGDYFSLGGDTDAVQAGIPTDDDLFDFDFDFVDDNTGIIQPQAGSHTVDNIKGELIIDGFSGDGSTGGLNEPILLPGETNILDSDGNVVGFTGTGEGETIDTMTVETADLQTVIANLSLLMLSDLVGKTLEISQGNGLRRFWQITTVGADVAGETTLSLLNVSQPSEEWGLPDSDSEYAINDLSANFFVDEDNVLDRVTVFDDGDITDNTGVLTNNSLTGLGLGTNGVTYGNFEIVEVLLGSGNDNFTINGTENGSITTVHGGGNSYLTNEFGDYVDEDGNVVVTPIIGGDTIIALDRGGTSVRKGGAVVFEASLVIFGDTSEDGSRYTGTVGTIQPTLAYNFTNVGNDTIDASAMIESVSIDGGEGNDNIKGSQADDHIGGGARNDNIMGLSGNDNIYGDSSFNVDVVTRDLTVATTGTAGQDIIDGGANDDIVFGDHGVIEQAAGTARILTTGNVERIVTNEFSNGANDIIKGGLGDDRILAGNGQDNITDIGGNNIILGDQGFINYLRNDNDLTDIDEISSVVDEINATDVTIGNSDSITTVGGDDIIFGGTNDVGVTETINAGDGNNIIIGDHGRIVSATSDTTRFGTHPLTLGQIETTNFAVGGDETINTGVGVDIIFGGFGGDTITASDLNNTTTDDENIVLGDDGEIVYDNDSNPTDIDEIVSTSTTSGGGIDVINTGEGEDIIIGGRFGDTINAREGDNIVIGDSGKITSATADSPQQLSGQPITIGKIETSEFGDGDGDNITTKSGKDIILGGFGGDTITASDLTNPTTDDDNIILGDDGEIVYDNDSNPADIDEIVSTSTTSGGGIDVINTGEGEDIIIGGRFGDIINAREGDNIVIGDSGKITSATADSPQQLTGQPIALGSIASSEFDDGGNDIINTQSGNDIILGGVGEDTINTNNVTVPAIATNNAISANIDNDIVIGDNGFIDYVSSDNDPSDIDLISTTNPNDGAKDTISTGAGNDIILAGTGGDTVIAGEGNDLVFGDHGKLEGDIDANLLPLDQANHPFTFTSIDTQNSDGGGNDDIQGNEGDDIIIAGQGVDTVRGNEGADDIIGGHNVADGHDVGDNLDGGSEDDAIAGDNASILRKGDAISNRVRKLSGTVIYDNNGNPQVTADAQANPSGNSERIIELFNHNDNPIANTSGNDNIAGGADDDVILDQLGDDKIQGDGAIEIDVATTGVSVEDSENDGDDYIEGNGGNDLIFGNLGQDDIVGGSSQFHGNNTASRRPDGEDTIFGGAGTDISRNNVGDQSNKGHAQDADVILGDNGNIYRLIGDDGQFLTFVYDNYDPTIKIIPRAIELLDYTLGGNASDIGADDTIQGEAGDDTIHGMTGNDVIFGNGQDDDAYGGTGFDRIYGGTGIDGILGDDGKIFTSRNGFAETINGLTSPNIEQFVNYSNTTGAYIYLTDDIHKSVILSAYEDGGSDIIYGGLGGDFIHAGAGDDAVSGAEALAQFYNDVRQTDSDPLGYNPDPSSRKLAAFDPNDPWRKITNFLLNFESTTAGGIKIDDGKDRIFGDLGNDWLVGGTLNDRLFGGLGDDVINADDNLETNNDANDIPDAPEYADFDFVFGGGSLDVMIANTGGDRLFDWSGEFNSFFIPFSSFGAPTVNRFAKNSIVNFLSNLGLGEGADTTRNEPDGELGIVTQKDSLWKDQKGGSRDPQPGTTNGSQDTTGGWETKDVNSGGNNAPVGTDDSATITNQEVATINVLANDTDADGDSLTVTNLTQPSNGVAVVNLDETITKH